MLVNRSILILNEAASSADSRTEQQNHVAMLLLMQGRFTIDSAHRFSAVRNAKQVRLVHGGVICRAGQAS